MELMVIPYFLTALLGARLGKGWLAKRPILAWIIVGLGGLSLAALAAAGPQKDGLVSLVLVPLSASLAAGVALGKLPLPGFLRGVMLFCVALGVGVVCALNTWWEFL